MTSVRLDTNKMRAAQKFHSDAATEIRDQAITIGFTAPKIAPPAVLGHLAIELTQISASAVKTSIETTVLSSQLGIGAFKMDAADGRLSAESLAGLVAIVPGSYGFVNGYSKFASGVQSVGKGAASAWSGTVKSYDNAKKAVRNGLSRMDFSPKALAKGAKNGAKRIPVIGLIPAGVEAGVGIVQVSGSRILADVLIHDPEQRKFFDAELREAARQGEYGDLEQVEQHYEDVTLGADPGQLGRMKAGEFGSVGRAYAAAHEAVIVDGGGSGQLGKEAILDYMYEFLGQDRYEANQAAPVL